MPPSPPAAAVPADNLIFDFGGVILDLAFNRTAAAFAALGGRPFGSVWTLRRQAPFFEAYETGHLSTSEFLAQLRDALALPAASDRALTDAWNAMLGTIPPSRLDHLLRLRTHHRIFLLSNTNALHMQCVEQNRLPVAARPLARYFDAIYLSHQIGHRKPTAAAFEHVLQAHSLDPARTAFIDDLDDNVEAARRLGLQGIVHPHGGDLAASVPCPERA